MNLEHIKEEFNKYYDLFDKSNESISYKYKHSYRVEELAKIIASNLKLSDEEIQLAMVIGLLHDIGRFKQLEMFNSYDDKNIDHADLGVKILFEDNLIEKFDIDHKYYDIIKFSIQNHNKFEISSVDDERMMLHAKIIRDADKVDILKAYSVFKDLKLKECDDDVTPAISDDFYNKKCIKRLDIKNNNDNNIMLIAFVYDLNFKISFELLKKQRIIENTFNEIEHKDIFKPYFEYLIKYIEEESIYAREEI